MINPNVYKKQIEELGIEGMVISSSSSDEAINILNKLRNVEEILQRIKHNVHIDMRTIRKEYIEKIDDIKDSSKIFGLYNKNRTNEDKRKEKKLLIIERDVKIAPYESLESIIEDYMKQIEDAKKYLENYIQKTNE